MNTQPLPTTRLPLALTLSLLAAALLAPAAPARAEYGAHTLRLEGGTAITFGSFKYSGADVSIEKTFMNPRLSAEFGFKDTSIAAGVEFARSKNQFDGTWKTGAGSVDIERTELAIYARLGERERNNLRLGYRRFSYDFTDGSFVDGLDNYLSATATGKLTTGVDLEATVAGGETLTFSLTAGATYFIGADYEWSYSLNGAPRVGNAAKLSAYSARLRPEISFKVGDSLRVFGNYMLSVSSWKGTPTGGKDYAGVDVYSGIGVGVRWDLRLGEDSAAAPAAAPAR
jgi:hypothetical protein